MDIVRRTARRNRQTREIDPEIAKDTNEAAPEHGDAAEAPETTPAEEYLPEQANGLEGHGGIEDEGAGAEEPVMHGTLAVDEIQQAETAPPPELESAVEQEQGAAAGLEEQPVGATA